jgi:hypothetical protein
MGRTVDATKKQPKVVLERYETKFVASLNWHLGEGVVMLLLGLELGTSRNY